MKKLLSLIMITVMILSVAILPVSAGRGYKLEAEYGTPVIDGKIDSIWGKSEAIVNNPADGDKKGSSDTATVKALWDENGFYFLVVAKDSKLEDAEIFEFYVDEAFDKSTTYNKNDRQSRIKVKTGELVDTIKDSDGNLTGRKDYYVKSAYTTTSDGWILEAAFKWIGNVKIKAGMSVGAEFMWDDQGAGVAWRWNVDTVNGDEKPYKTSKDFGELILKEKPAPATTAAPATAKAPAAATTAAPKTADPIVHAVVALAAVMGTGIVLVRKRK